MLRIEERVYVFVLGQSRLSDIVTAETAGSTP